MTMANGQITVQAMATDAASTKFGLGRLDYSDLSSSFL